MSSAGGYNREELEKLVDKIIEIDDGFCLCFLDIKDLREQDRNARYLSKEAMNQLVHNIRKEGHLESLPLCVFKKGKIYIISGHHRVRAARLAGVKKVWVLLYTRDLSDDQIKAKQLAHNAIQGVDDRSVLAEIFNSIRDVDARIESFIRKKDIDIKEPDRVVIEEPEVKTLTKSVSFVFFPHQLEKLEEVIALLKGDDCVFVASMDVWDEFVSSLRRLKADMKIYNTGAAISKMCDIVKEVLDEREREKDSGDN